jgi:hypothetical protein
MWKYLGSLVFFGAFLFGWPCVAENQQGKAHTEQNQTAQTQRPDPPTHVVIDPSSATIHIKAETDNAEKTSPEKPWKQFLGPEWVIVYITAIYVALSGWMLIAIKRQSGHMASQVQEMKAQTAVAQASAENALLNTKTLIAAERAWIVVSVESPAPGKFNFIARNVGRTPAKVRSIWSIPIIVKRDELLRVPPDEATGESLLSTPPCLIPPTATQIILRCDIAELDKRNAFGPNMTFFQGFASIWFYGRIIYSDILQPESAISHETKWLYWHIPQEGAIPFPDPMRPQHNTYT